MSEVILKKSCKAGKKYDTVIDGKNDFFIWSNDFAKRKDEERKQGHIARHGATQTFKDIEKPQTWARYILWEKKTIPEALTNMEKKITIDIKMKK